MNAASDAELGRLTTDTGLTIGNSLTGTIVVDGVTDASSDAVATITLIATKAAKEELRLSKKKSKTKRSITTN